MQPMQSMMRKLKLLWQWTGTRTYIVIFSLTVHPDSNEEDSSEKIARKRWDWDASQCDRHERFPQALALEHQLWRAAGEGPPSWIARTWIVDVLALTRVFLLSSWATTAK